MPKFSWKFSNGLGSKLWTTLSESSYHRMMETAAKRIRARAKKECGLKDPDLGFGWRIDLRLENEVETISEGEDGGDENEIAPAAEKEKKRKVKTKGKKEKKSKGKTSKKRKRSQGTKVCCPPIIYNPTTADTCENFQPRKKARRSPAKSGLSGTSGSESDSESESTDSSELATVAKLQNENICARCLAPCMLLTDTSHHRFSGEELSLWATMIVWPSCLLFVVKISNEFIR